MTKWSEFLKAEEEVKSKLGDTLARPTPSLPEPLRKAMKDVAPADPGGEITFEFTAPNGTVPITTGIPHLYSLVQDTFKSIGLTMEKARSVLAIDHNVSVEVTGEMITFRRIPEGTPRDLGAKASADAAKAMARLTPGERIEMETKMAYAKATREKEDAKREAEIQLAKYGLREISGGRLVTEEEYQQIVDAVGVDKSLSSFIHDLHESLKKE